MSDEEIRRQWGDAVRCWQKGREGSLSQRIALAIADRMEAQGVTEADLDRLGLSPKTECGAAT